MISINEKIDILNQKIFKLQDIYEANEINIEKIDQMGPEPDYGIEECLRLKNELSLKIQALILEKQALTNQ